MLTEAVYRNSTLFYDCVTKSLKQTTAYMTHFLMLPKASPMIKLYWEANVIDTHCFLVKWLLILLQELVTKMKIKQSGDGSCCSSFIALETHRSSLYSPWGGQTKTHVQTGSSLTRVNKAALTKPAKQNSAACPETSPISQHSCLV